MRHAKAGALPVSLFRRVFKAREQELTGASNNEVACSATRRLCY